MTATATRVVGGEVGDRATFELTAWVIDPAAGRSGRAELSVRDGTMESLRWRDGGPDPSLVVAPGFTDLHVHLREPGNEAAETVESGLAAAAHGGFTTVC